MLRLAQLPFAREIRYASATPQKIDETVMVQQLRSQANRARDELRQIAEQHALAWSFRVLRGLVATELLAAAAEADLLVLGRSSRQAVPCHWLGSTARTAVRQRQRPVLLMHPNFNLDHPPLLLYDGSAAAQRAVSVAVDMARANGRLSILLLTPGEAEAQRWQREVRTQLVGDTVQIDWRTVADAVKLTAVLSQIEVGFIVTSQTDSPLSQAVLESLFQAGEQPVLIVQ